jgi:hypothetical protein
LEALAELAAEHRDASLAEYADLLAERTGKPKRTRDVHGWIRHAGYAPS